MKIVDNIWNEYGVSKTFFHTMKPMFFIALNTLKNTSNELKMTFL
jgi:hypothetical protein